MDKCTTISRFRGCLLGGAVGDALGAPVEFESHASIIANYGEQGITDHDVAYGKLGAITDDTQMTLFTAEGLLRAKVRQVNKGICCISSVVSHAYLRWLKTQGEAHTVPYVEASGYLYSNPVLHSQRAPGTTCLTSLSKMPFFGSPANNNSKGCGAIMRVAPVALIAFADGCDDDWIVRIAKDISALTHGHPTGQIASAFLAVLIYKLLGGATLDSSIQSASLSIENLEGADETLRAVRRAIELATYDPSGSSLNYLGHGWVAEEALSIALYCSLVASSLEDAVVLSVNHDGDSDSTGAITGNVRGAMEGVEVIPERWLRDLELRSTIEGVAIDLLELNPHSPEAWDRYPGS